MEIFAQAAVGADQITQGWIAAVTQLATAGGFGALVWYLMTKHIPAIEKRHSKERSDEVAAFFKHLDHRDGIMDGITERNIQSQKEHTEAVNHLRLELVAMQGRQQHPAHK